MSAHFITFEGGEGCGKSVQSSLLVEWLKSKSIEAICTKEPGGTDIGQELRKILVQGNTDKLDCISEMLLYYADRRIHLSSKVWPALAENKWVISDRFADSTVAYQYYGYECRIEKNLLMNMYNLVAGNFLPDLTIILDIDAKKGLQRSFEKAKKMQEKELRFENMDLHFHENIRQGFLQIAKENPQRCVVINADRGIEEIHDEIKTIITQRFGESF